MHRPKASITAYRDGPYLVRGPVRLVDEDGQELVVRREVVPLCRCGRSRTKPLCDGAHAAGLFRGPPTATCHPGTSEMGADIIRWPCVDTDPSPPAA